MDNITKPICKLNGSTDLFTIVGLVTKTLWKHGLTQEADAFKSKAVQAITSLKSYADVMRIVSIYVEVR